MYTLSATASFCFPQAPQKCAGTFPGFACFICISQRKEAEPVVSVAESSGFPVV